ncbi:MAG: hypothetical protein HC878_00120 [Leptolyngbyaceae cyanobacterium SL_5_14]|nr:hypothetical protein [Leptolyngbyaceae cyanobacterium SL_5_14]
MQKGTSGGFDTIFLFICVGAAAFLVAIFFQGEATDRELELKDQQIQQMQQYQEGLKDGIIFGGSDQ